jgi:hypothetical protein
MCQTASGASMAMENFARNASPAIAGASATSVSLARSLAVLIVKLIGQFVQMRSVWTGITFIKKSVKSARMAAEFVMGQAVARPVILRMLSTWTKL